MSDERILIDNCIIDFIYGMAIKDAMNRVSAKGDMDRVYKNGEIKKAVWEYARKIIDGGTNDILFPEAVDKMEKANKKDDYRIKNFTFGKIQKLINMTMKYLYLEYLHSSEIRKFDQCHAPMDSVMRDFVFESYYIVLGKERTRDEVPIFDRNCAWSKLQTIEGDYMNFQNAIDGIIKYSGLSINRIEFDYLFWDKAKELQNKSRGNQRILTEKIWKEIK